jgi:ABC-type antimicrobial peptide transport system permease subunit
VNPLDPMVYAASAAVMTAVVLLATYLPARDILRMDPMAVLGRE